MEQNIKQLEVSQAEIVEAFRLIQTKVATISNVDNPSIKLEEHEVFKQKMDDFIQVTSSHLVQLKRQLNMLADINKLPIEIFEYIILLANNPLSNNRHPYISYTWVCSHWRSVLVHNPAFWALIRHTSKRLRPVEPLDYELIQRSKSSNLDVILSTQSPSYVETLLSSRSDRIRRLSLSIDERLIKLVLSVAHFPSLQKFSFNACSDYHNPRLLSILASSDHLTALEFTLWNNTPIHDLASILGRIRNLKLAFITSPDITRSILDLLHQSHNIQSLQLRAVGAGDLRTNSSDILLPELQFLAIDNPSLTGIFRAPKLSSLDMTFIMPASAYLVPEDFDFLTIRYLYIRCPQSERGAYGGNYCILGSKERIQCKSMFSLTTDLLLETPHDCPQGCFHFKLLRETEFLAMLHELSIIPRLTNLVELYLLIPHTITKLEDIMAQVPSVEKVVIQRGNKLLIFIHLLNDTSLCPRLKHLSFTTFLLPKNLEKYARDVGKALTQCLQSRRDASVQQLKYIALRNCPPLPDKWLEELQELGAEVVTDKKMEDVIIKKRRADKDEKFSDVEI